VPRTRRRRILLVAGALIGVAALGAIGAVELRRPPEALHGPDFTLRAVDLARTGHQRAERLVFADNGKMLAVTCPRYNYLVIYRVADGPRLELHRDIRLEGRPVGLATTGDRFYVLQRPHGDARHIEPAWWDLLDLDGAPAGPRYRVGFDPDDLVLVDDGRTALVLLSGSAEGETNRPPPCLNVVDLSDPDQPQTIGSVTLDGPGDDPEWLVVQAGENSASIGLFDAGGIVQVDLRDRQAPRITSRQSADSSAPQVEYLVDDGQPMVRERRPLPDTNRSGLRTLGLSESQGAVTVWAGDEPLGELPLPGFGGVRPMALAIAPNPQGALVAVSDRSGGVHLLTWTDTPSARTSRVER
jgi:hypothetical protein